MGGEREAGEDLKDIENATLGAAFSLSVRFNLDLFLHKLVSIMIPRYFYP